MPDKQGDEGRSGGGGLSWYDAGDEHAQGEQANTIRDSIRGAAVNTSDAGASRLAVDPTPDPPSFLAGASAEESIADLDREELPTDDGRGPDAVAVRYTTSTGNESDTRGAGADNSSSFA